MVITLAVITESGEIFRNGAIVLALSCGGLIDGLSTASIDSLYSTFEAVTRPIDTKHQKAALKTMKISANKII